MKGNTNCRGFGSGGGGGAGRRTLERDFRLGFDGPTRPPIGQPLAFDALQGGNRPLGIRDAEARAIVVTEIELADVPLKVRLADMVIGADDAALED